MNRFRKYSALALVLAGLWVAQPRAYAQDFGLNASASPNSVEINNPVLYTIAVTNLNAFAIDNVFVTNALSGAFVFNSATINRPGAFFTNSFGDIVFRINNFIGGDIAQLTLSLSPVAGGFFTNTITAGAFGRTNAVTNLVTQVNFPPADLGISMTNAATGVLTNDTTTIGLLVTNLGPSSASGVTVTNTLPTSFKLLSVSPAAVSNSFLGGNLILRVGTMASGSSTQLLVSVQPTNAGPFDLIASVSATNITDTNAANSVVTNSMTVGAVSGNLQVVILNQSFNLQTGLLEQRVRVTNTNATDVDAARVIASAMPSGARLYNASGTNSGSAYALYNSAISAGNFADLVLEFYVLKVSTFTNTLSAFGVPAISLTAPPTSGVIITNKAMSSGGFLVEFPAIIGRTYTIVYADNISFSNALVAQPSIVAPATQVQWIDNGPPKTVSHPTSAPQRYYRVFQSQ